ncbi:MAG: alanyl-tRNA editing protein [Anaerolineae bacterium]|nr:alanyl-tRNA editing protein [Anaerolineae bacterium]
MTDKIFWLDPYRTELETRVAAVDGGDITLSKTIFYAFSGGQESDMGTIGGYPVLRAEKVGTSIRCTLPPDHGLAPGDLVIVSIDWERRYALMRLHFAAEIVLELVYQTLPGIEKIGAHIAPDKARLDFAWDGNISEVFPDIQQRADALITADHPIISAFSDEAREERYWEIKGFARVPCGGTHLRTTGEVGAIALRRKNPGRGKERIEVTVSGNPAST